MKEILSLVCREVLYVSTNLTMMVLFMNHIFVKRRSPKILIAFLVGKVLLINIFFRVLLLWIPENATIKGICLISATFIGLSSYLFLQYTYKAELIVIIISGIICEILAVCMGNLFSVFLNLISGREMLILDTEFHMIDLLFPVLSVLTIPIACKVLEPLFARLRSWKVKHKIPFFAGIGIYFLTGVYTNLGGFEKSTLFQWFYVITMALLLFWWYVQFFYRKVRREKEYLKKQQKLSKLEYGAITLQIEKMEMAQKTISEQMQKIMEIPEDAEGRTQHLERYIKSLKKQKETIMQGMFCDSWLLDSVLCHQMMKCRDRNIIADFRLWNYKKGMIQEENLAELVHYLLETFLSNEDTEKIFLYMASIKGQLVIWAGYVRGDSRQQEKEDEGHGRKAYGQNRISNRKIRKYMRRHQITISRKREGCQMKVNIIIE